VAQQTIYDLLKKDHRTVLDLLNKLDGTSEKDEADRKKLFAQLKQELDVHKEAEEKTFYRELKKHDDAREDVLESLEEHRVTDKILRDIEAVEVGDERWGPRVHVLKEILEHHIEEEEDDIFEAARKNLDKSQAEEIGARFAEAKKAAS
jgi:hypothetical protein